MPEPTHAKRVTRALESLRAVADPLIRLDAVRAALEQLEELQASTVAEARAGGATWSEVGAIYGLTKQGAQQRFRTVKP